MSQSSQNAVAIFIASGAHNEKSDAAKQSVLRECAARLCLTIVSFVAIPKISLFQCLSQTLDICKRNAATVILIDDLKTIFLSRKELILFFKNLQEHKINLVTARAGAVLTQDFLAIFADWLEIISAVEHEQRALSIKKSLLLKKRQGIKLGGKKFGIQGDESEIIKQILDLNMSGKSLQEICDILSINNIKSMYNKKWHPTTIKRIITRSKI